tara:strand:+ start:40 stop:360 length:321 start_codon:yes stop_codon:yes gene_type:complete
MMKYDDLKSIIKEVLEEQKDPWKQFLDKTRKAKQIKMVPRSAPPEPKREPSERENVRGVDEFDTEEEARNELNRLFKTTDTARRRVYKTKEGKYFVAVVEDPRKGT